MAQKKLSDTLQTAFDEADGIMQRAFQEASTKVKSARAGRPNGNGNGDYGHCLVCSCGMYVSPTGTGGQSSFS